MAQFIAASCDRHRQTIRQVSDEALRALTAASWPGNVRELQHYIERAIVTTTHLELTCTDLVAMGSHAKDGDLRTIVRDATRQAERTRILQVLQQTSGNRVRAARLLNTVSRSSLYNKLRDFGIQQQLGLELCAPSRPSSVSQPRITISRIIPATEESPRSFPDLSCLRITPSLSVPLDSTSTCLLTT